MESSLIKKNFENNKEEYSTINLTDIKDKFDIPIMNDRVQQLNENLPIVKDKILTKTKAPILPTISSKSNHNCSKHLNPPRKLIKKKKEWFGPTNIAIDKKQFRINHPNEIFPDILNHEIPGIQVINNNIKFKEHENPYMKMVNQATNVQVNKNGDVKSHKVFGFKSKNYYEKAHDLSLMPTIAKYDSLNPIFLHMANPHDYRFYQIIE